MRNHKIFSVFLTIFLIGTILFSFLLNSYVATYAFLYNSQNTPNKQPETTMILPSIRFSEFSQSDYAICSHLAWQIANNLANRGVKATITFSTSIIIFSETILIVIGHGSYIKGQYYIGDLSFNELNKLSAGKEYVALLACYSSLTRIQSSHLLTYETEVTLQTAIEDLITFINIDFRYKLDLPKIKLVANEPYALDSGGVGGGSGSSTNKNFFEFVVASTTYNGVYLRYNLNDKNSAELYGTFIKSHPNVIFHINAGGDFTIVKERSYFFGLLRRTEETTEYHYLYCNQYGEFRDVLVEDSNGYMTHEQHLFLITYGFILDKNTPQELKDSNNSTIIIDTNNTTSYDNDELTDAEATVLAALIDAIGKIAASCIAAGVTILITGVAAQGAVILGMSVPTLLSVIGIGLIVLGIVCLIVLVVVAIIYSTKA